MKKDVIYIDVDDDVTAIIGKVKEAKEKLVVLVPPKRAGALQSAVNLRLLQRMVKSDGKHLVLVTSNPALVGLAAAANIPVAKNLQSKPEVPEVPALIVDDDDDIIDGASIPVGEHAKTSKLTESVAKDSRSDAIESVDMVLDDGNKPVTLTPAASASKSKPSPKAKSSKKGIPDFDKFRKKLFLSIGGGVVLIALLVWAFVFAPGATITITAKTSPEIVNAGVQLGGTAATSFEKGIVSSVSKQEEKELSVEFDATGEKNVGEKASGTMKLSRVSVSSEAIAIPAGTRFTRGSSVFVSTEAGTLAGTSIGPGGIIQDSIVVSVEATSPGASNNLANGLSYQSNMGGFSATGSAMTGGSDRMAKVVTSADVERATGRLAGESTDDYKKELIASFSSGEKVIESSFKLEKGDVVSSPAVDQEASNGKAKLTMKAKLSIHAIQESELASYLKEYLNSKIDDNQEIFDNGLGSATIADFSQEGGSSSATINTTAKIGPKIDKLEIKELSKGRIYGDVQSSLQSQTGVQDVDVKFSYFWVRTVPNDVNKIEVEFKVEDE